MESSIVADDVFETVGRRKEREREREGGETIIASRSFLPTLSSIHSLPDRVDRVIDSKFGGKN